MPTKVITRKISFGPKEVRDALLRDLASQDQPVPKSFDEVKWILGPAGASVEWTENSGDITSAQEK